MAKILSYKVKSYSKRIDAFLRVNAKNERATEIHITFTGREKQT